MLSLAKRTTFLSQAERTPFQSLSPRETQAVRLRLMENLSLIPARLVNLVQKSSIPSRRKSSNETDLIRYFFNIRNH